MFFITCLLYFLLIIGYKLHHVQLWQCIHVPLFRAWGPLSWSMWSSLRLTSIIPRAGMLSWLIRLAQALPKYSACGGHCHDKIKCGACSDSPQLCKYNLIWLAFIRFIGASPSEPHTGQTASPTMFIYMYVGIVHHFVNKCSHVLIHWKASILPCVINSVNATMFK